MLLSQYYHYVVLVLLLIVNGNYEWFSYYSFSILLEVV